MKNFGLIGNKIEYSISKHLHLIIAKYFNLKLNYEIYDISNDNIKVLIEMLRNGNVNGFNVTKPYKVSIMKMLDKLSEKAKSIGACNTIYLEGSEIVGTNTDFAGFRGMIELNQIELRGKRVYLLGTGGAARACYLYLRSCGSNVVAVMNENRPKDLFINVIKKEEIDFNWPDIIVNATPVGTFPLVDESFVDPAIGKNKIVIDLIYNPIKTKLMSEAKYSYSGIDMLIIQAIESEKIWFNLDFKYDKEDILKIKKELLENEYVRQII